VRGGPVHPRFVPQDEGGLVRLLGGDRKTVAKLDAMFDYDISKLDYSSSEDIAGLIGQYIHGNEPSHSVAYLYNYAGAPWRTQERLKQIVPGVSQVAVLWQPGALGGRTDMLKPAEVAARALRIRLQFVEAQGPAEFDRAFSEMTRARVGALAVLGSAIFNSERRRLVDLAAKHRLPTVYTSRDFVDVGGLMTYGPSLADSFRRAAAYVDKILKGAKPADLPVEQPTKFELVINLKAAKALGLTIPPSLIQRADQVIE